MGVKVSGLHVEFPDQIVFENVNLEVADNEIVAIETHVLDGGTSLLKGIGGMLNGVGGSVTFQGVDLLKDPPPAVRARIGFVYESRGLVSIYNVFQNISLPLQFHTSLSLAEINRRVDDICKFVGIAEEIYFFMPHRLNDVRTRLVNLARALVVEPGLLLMDEIEGGMSDDILQATMTRLRQRQQQYPMAIVITTSSPIVMERADRVYDIANRGLVPKKGGS